MEIKDKKKEGLYSQIQSFFEEIKNKDSKQVKKIKKKAMSKNIHLAENRKKFCKYCLTPYNGSENIRIKNNHKIVVCKNCGKKNKIKIMLS
jgi:RNase P subunit RPR2